MTLRALKWGCHDKNLLSLSLSIEYFLMDSKFLCTTIFTKLDNFRMQTRPYSVSYVVNVFSANEFLIAETWVKPDAIAISRGRRVDKSSYKEETATSDNICLEQKLRINNCALCLPISDVEEKRSPRGLRQTFSSATSIGQDFSVVAEPWLILETMVSA